MKIDWVGTLIASGAPVRSRMLPRGSREFSPPLLARPRQPGVLLVMHHLQGNQFAENDRAPDRITPASHFRRRSTMTRCVSQSRPLPLLHSWQRRCPVCRRPDAPPGPPSASPGSGSRATCWQALRAQQFGFLQLERAAFVEQTPLLGLQRFQLVSPACWPAPGTSTPASSTSSTRPLRWPTSTRRANAGPVRAPAASCRSSCRRRIRRPAAARAAGREYFRRRAPVSAALAALAPGVRRPI